MVRSRMSLAQPMNSHEDFCRPALEDYIRSPRPRDIVFKREHVPFRTVQNIPAGECVILVPERIERRRLPDLRYFGRSIEYTRLHHAVHR